MTNDALPTTSPRQALLIFEYILSKKVPEPYDYLSPYWADKSTATLIVPFVTPEGLYGARITLDSFTIVSIRDGVYRAIDILLKWFDDKHKWSILKEEVNHEGNRNPQDCAEGDPEEG